MFLLAVKKPAGYVRTGADEGGGRIARAKGGFL